MLGAPRRQGLVSRKSARPPLGLRAAAVGPQSEDSSIVRARSGSPSPLSSVGRSAAAAEGVVPILAKIESDIQIAQDAPTLPKIDVPSYKTLLLFMIPTLGIYLATPILSLVDTAFVGRYCGSIALAALGPATALCDMVVFLSAFMSVATTNLFASALARGDRKGGRRIVASIMSMSAILGVTVGAVLCLTAPAVVPWVIGAASTDTVPFALQYVTVRAIGVPFAMVLSIAQAAAIGAKESVAPLAAVIMQSLLNVVLDWWMVGPLGMGVAGAAWATILSQVVASLYLCHRVANLLTALKQEEKIEDELPSLSDEIAPGDGTGIPIKKINVAKKQSMQSLRSWVGMVKVLSVIPNKEEFQEVRAFCGPLFFMRAVQGFYWWSCAFAAASAGTIALAAHQVLIGLFWLFAVASEALSVMGQTFLPVLSERQTQAQALLALDDSQENRALVQAASDKVVKLTKRVALIGLAFGVTQATMGGILASLFASAFTKDAAVVAVVKSTALLLGLCIVPHSFSFALEGLLVSVRDLTFLGNTYVFNAFVWAGFLQYMRVSSPHLSTLWAGLVIFNMTRATQWVIRSIVAGHRVGLPIFPYALRRLQGLAKGGSKPAQAA